MFLISTLGLYLLTIYILGIRIENIGEFINEVKLNFLPPILLLLVNSILYGFSRWKKILLMLLWTITPVILFLFSVRFQPTDPGGFMIFSPNTLEIGLLIPIIITIIQLIAFLIVALKKKEC